MEKLKCTINFTYNLYHFYCSHLVAFFSISNQVTNEISFTPIFSCCFLIVSMLYFFSFLYINSFIRVTVVIDVVEFFFIPLFVKFSCVCIYNYLSDL